MGQETHTIGIISDTHGLLRPEVAEALAGCDAILHGGDVCQRGILRELERIAPVYAVRGNNDKDWEKPLPETLRVTLFGVSFYMIHDRKQIAEDVGGAQIVLFGHTHRFEAKTGDEVSPDGKRSRSGGLLGVLNRKRPGNRGLSDGAEGERLADRDAAGGAQLWLNPGSCGPKRLRLPITMAFLEIAGDVGCRLEKAELSSKGGLLYRETAAIWTARSGNVQSGGGAGVWELCVPHAGEPGKADAGSGSSGDASLSGEGEEDPVIPADIGVRIPGMIRDMKRGRPVAEIARRAGVSYGVAEQVCRMYATHPGVDVDGILRRLGL